MATRKDRYTTGTGQKLVNVHASETCTGRWCVIHRPCPGPWNDWPTHWRGDTEVWGINLDIWRGFQRICPCEIGHPAVEEVMRNPQLGLHGCCGCPCSVGHCDEIWWAGEMIGYKLEEGHGQKRLDAG